MLEPPTAILLVGPSSSGKTTTALELRRRLVRGSIYLSGDDLDLPQPSASVAFLRASRPAEMAEWEGRFYRAFFGAMVAVREAGLHAIGELIFKSPAHTAVFEDTLTAPGRLLVRLSASPSVRLERERARGDRPAGTAAATEAQEFVPDAVDLSIDTSELATDQVVDQIIARVAQEVP